MSKPKICVPYKESKTTITTTMFNSGILFVWGTLGYHNVVWKQRCFCNLSNSVIRRKKTRGMSGTVAIKSWGSTMCEDGLGKYAVRLGTNCSCSVWVSQFVGTIAFIVTIAWEEFQSRPSLVCFAFGSDVGPGKCCAVASNIAVLV